jgi:hypothetical protein
LGIVVARPTFDAMTLHLESQVVASKFDAATQTCHYTIERDGQRFTASVALEDLRKYQNNKQARRAHIANALTAAMHGEPD